MDIQRENKEGCLALSLSHGIQYQQVCEGLKNYPCHMVLDIYSSMGTSLSVPMCMHCKFSPWAHITPTAFVDQQLYVCLPPFYPIIESRFFFIKIHLIVIFPSYTTFSSFPPLCHSPSTPFCLSWEKNRPLRDKNQMWQNKIRRLSKSCHIEVGHSIPTGEKSLKNRCLIQVPTFSHTKISH